MNRISSVFSRSSNVIPDEDVFPLNSLPCSVLSAVLRKLPPSDVARLASVNHSWNDTAMADVVWNDFIPEYWRNVIPNASTRSASKLYSDLVRGELINDGKQMIQIDRHSGRVSLYTSCAKGMWVCWSDHPQYWEVEAHFDGSYFDKTAMLRAVWWFQIEGDVSIFVVPGKYSFSWRVSRGPATGNLSVTVPSFQWHGRKIISRVVVKSKEDSEVLDTAPVETVHPVSRRTIAEYPSWSELHVTDIEFGAEVEGGKLLNVHVSLCETISNTLKSGMLVDCLIVKQIA